MPRPQRRRRFYATGEREPQVRRGGTQREVNESEDAELAPTLSPTDEQPVTPASETADEERAEENEGDTRDGLPFRTMPPRGRRLVRRRFSLLFVLLVSCLCLTLGAFGGYLLPKPVPAAPIAEPRAADNLKLLTPADEEELDAAYASRHAGKLTEAEGRFAALGQAHPAWGNLALEVGRTQLYRGDFAHASVSLKTAIERGWKAAEANCVLGVMYHAQRAFPQAELGFATAVALDPTQPDYYFLWGECLRSEGKALEATAKFRSALLRNQYETANGLYQAKLWLSEIEANQEVVAGTNAAIDRALQQTRPPMEALVAAAARELKAGNSQAATKDLLRARDRADKVIFSVVLRDQTFASLRGQPEFANPQRAALPLLAPLLNHEPGVVNVPGEPVREGMASPADPR